MRVSTLLYAALALASNGSNKSNANKEADEPVVHGRWRNLTVSAPENQRLLNIETLPIQDTEGTIGDALTQNRELYDELDKVLKMRYFSTYKVDLSDSKCPLEDDDAQCANSQCAIEPLSMPEIDDSVFKAQFLGRLRKDSIHDSAPEGQKCIPIDAPLAAGVSNDTKNYCYPEDESLHSEGVWVDLINNVERFTGYQGPSARNMWGMLYAENCFSYNGDAPSPKAPAGDLANVFKNPRDLTVNTSELDLDLSQDCIEQRLFYRLLSGLHASISTHLCYNWWNATSEQWEAVLPDWLERVGWFDDRVNNMFFDYTLVSRAVLKLVDGFDKELVFSSSYKPMDEEVRTALESIAAVLRKSPLANAIDEHTLFQSPETDRLKTEFRQRVRNTNALMSCVGCERCRLWGKIQTAGYGTALKILLEFPENAEKDPKLTKELLRSFRRSELVALINTFGRISTSVHATDVFTQRAKAEVQAQIDAKNVDEHSWTNEWKIVLGETKEALHFIFKSYIDFPKNVAKLFLYNAAYYWDRLVNGNRPEELKEYRVKADL